jgi:hypothetical protein
MMWSPRRRRLRPRWRRSVGRACVELLVHTDDALSGLGVAFTPPADLCQRVLAQQFPDAARPGSAWHGLLAATGRPIR